MHRRLCALLVLALPQAALAVDLDASLEIGSTYDNNVFNEDEDDHDGLNAKHDVAATLQPNILLTQPFSRGTTSLNYFATLQRWFLNRDIRSREIDDNHFGSWNFEYALGRRTTLTLSDTVESSLNQDFAFVRSETDVSLDEEVQGRNTVNSASAGIEHTFSRRLLGSLSGGHQLFRSQDEDQVESQAFHTEGSLRYRLGSDHTVGISSSVSTQFYQRFVDPDGNGTPGEPGDDVIVPSSRSLFASGQATWGWEVLPETVLSVAAGPAWVYTRREEQPTCLLTEPVIPHVGGDGCPSFRGADTTPGLAPATSSDRITVFASASITQRLGDNFRARLAYNRSEAAAQGTSGGSVRDSIHASLTWQISQRAEVALLGSWNQRNSATELDTRTNQGQIDSARWTLGGRGNYQLTRRLALRGQVTYARQKSEDDVFESTLADGSTVDTVVRGREQDQVRASLGLVYHFERMSFFD